MSCTAWHKASSASRPQKANAFGDACSDRAAFGYGARLQRLPERFPVQQFGHRVRGAVSDAEIVNREDIGMRQRSQQAGFAFETRQPIPIAREPRAR